MTTASDTVREAMANPMVDSFKTSEMEALNDQQEMTRLREMSTYKMAQRNKGANESAGLRRLLGYTKVFFTGVAVIASLSAAAAQTTSGDKLRKTNITCSPLAAGGIDGTRARTVSTWTRFRQKFFFTTSGERRTRLACQQATLRASGRREAANAINVCTASWKLGLIFKPLKLFTKLVVKLATPAATASEEQVQKQVSGMLSSGADMFTKSSDAFTALNEAKSSGKQLEIDKHKHDSEEHDRNVQQLMSDKQRRTQQQQEQLRSEEQNLQGLARAAGAA